MDTIDQILDQMRNLVSENDTKEALRFLEEMIPSQDHQTLNQIATLKGDLNRLTRKEVLNSIPEDQLNIKMNDFADRMLQFVAGLTVQDFSQKPQVQVVPVQSRPIPADFRLAVISAHQPAALKIQRLFKLAGVHPVDLFYHPMNWSEVNLEAYTLVIFDNQDLKECPKDFLLEKLPPEAQELILSRIEEMETYLSLYEDKFIIYFGDFLYWVNQKRDRVHPANSKFSLYSRTMEALDFIRAFQV